MERRIHAKIAQSNAIALGVDPQHPGRLCVWHGTCPISDVFGWDCPDQTVIVQSRYCWAPFGLNGANGRTNLCCERERSISQAEEGPAPLPKPTFFQSANSVIGSIKAGVPVS